MNTADFVRVHNQKKRKLAENLRQAENVLKKLATLAPNTNDHVFNDETNEWEWVSEKARKKAEALVRDQREQAQRVQEARKAYEKHLG